MNTTAETALWPRDDCASFAHEVLRPKLHIVTRYSSPEPLAFSTSSMFCPPTKCTPITSASSSEQRAARFDCSSSLIIIVS
jgi:hypothetical protein